jgi:hypothetical protein
MLAGDLEHAWLTTRKLLHDDPTATTTILLPIGYPGSTPDEHITWSYAATLAFCALLEDSGRSTTLVAVKCSQLIPSGEPYRSVTILRAPGTPWSLQEVVCTIDRAFLRRLEFRLMDCLPYPPNLSYCYDESFRTTREFHAQCAETYGWRHWVSGAHASRDSIRDMASALEWIKDQLTALESVAV